MREVVAHENAVLRCKGRIVGVHLKSVETRALGKGLCSDMRQFCGQRDGENL